MREAGGRAGLAWLGLAWLVCAWPTAACASQIACSQQGGGRISSPVNGGSMVIYDTYDDVRIDAVNDVKCSNDLCFIEVQCHIFCSFAPWHSYRSHAVTAPASHERWPVDTQASCKSSRSLPYLATGASSQDVIPSASRCANDTGVFDHIVQGLLTLRELPVVKVIRGC